MASERPSAEAMERARRATMDWTKPQGLMPSERLNEEWVEHLARTIDAAVRAQKERDAQVCEQVQREHVRHMEAADEREIRNAHVEAAEAATTCARRIRTEEGGNHD